MTCRQVHARRYTMNKPIRTIMQLMLMVLTTATAAVIHIPGDQPTIQAGISMAGTADTVLVAPGTYYENLNLLGKELVLASHFILDGDQESILNTIIDGSQPIHPDTASVILMVNGEPVGTQVCGFTITGGAGTAWLDEHGAGTFREGGGILMNASQARICHNRIVDNRVENEEGVTSTGGGGIRVGDGYPEISNNLIMRNYGRYGGGIVLNFTGAYIHNNLIAWNESSSSYSGGTGIWTYENGDSGKVITNNTIVANQATGGCAGVSLQATEALLMNNIIYGNVSGLDYQIALPGGGTYSGDYNLIGGLEDSVDPLLGWVGAEDVRLLIGSPAIDGGDPDPASNDADGSRNDIGYTGGPDGQFLPPTVGVHEFHTQSERPWLRPGLDSLLVRVMIYDPLDDEHSVYVLLESDSLAESLQFDLFDDGTHGDSLAGDMVYCTWLSAPEEELDFSFSTRVFNVRDSLTVSQAFSDVYTTAGPVRLSGITVFNEDPTFFPGAVIGFFNLLSNQGGSSLISNVHIKGELLQGGVLFNPDAAYGNIAAGDTAQTNVVSIMNVDPEIEVGDEVVIAYALYSGNYPFWADTLRVSVQAEPVSIGSTGLPDEFMLLPAHPNPFNPSTTIRYHLPEAVTVSVRIYDPTGRRIRTLLSARQPAGSHELHWNGVGDSGEPAGSGVYFCRVHAGDLSRTMKLVLAR